MELKRNLSLAAYLSARKTYMQRKISSSLPCSWLFSDSVVLFNVIWSEVDVLILYLSFEIRETMNKIISFIALIPLKLLILPSGSHIVSCFSARAEILFRLHENFSDLLARFAGLTGLRFFHVIAFAGPARLISPSSHQNQARSGLPWFIASTINRAGSPHVIPGWKSSRHTEAAG